MNFLSDCITYVRRLIKSPSDAVITDNLIIDYINRFWLMDVDARIQLFDLKTKYQFQTVPGVDQYNMPLYDVQTQPGNQQIASFPVYQGFFGPAFCNGIQMGFHTQRGEFFNVWPNYVQPANPVILADGGSTYNIQIPFTSQQATTVNLVPPGLLRGHVDIAGIIATGINEDPPVGSTLDLTIPTTSVYSAVYFTTIDSTGASVVVADSGQFLTGNVNYGLLMRPGNAPLGNIALSGGYTTTSNTINYMTGEANVTFTDSAGAPISIPAGQNINSQCYTYQVGLPRSCLFYNNIITLRNPPDKQYLIELDAYLTPAAFLSTSNAVPFGYMTEYIARGAARKILSDTGDTEQFMFYEPLFREQEILVWKRSQRQFTSNRTQTIYSGGQQGQAFGNNNSLGIT